MKTAQDLSPQELLILNGLAGSNAPLEEKTIGNDVEILKQLLYEANRTIRRLRRSMMAHPDYKEGIEFDDFTTLAQETEDKIAAVLSPHPKLEG